MELETFTKLRTSFTGAYDEFAKEIYKIYDKVLEQVEEDDMISFEEPTFDYDFAYSTLVIRIELYNEATDKVTIVTYRGETESELISGLIDAYNKARG